MMKRKMWSMHLRLGGRPWTTRGKLSAEGGGGGKDGKKVAIPTEGGEAFGVVDSVNDFEAAKKIGVVAMAKKTSFTAMSEGIREEGEGQEPKKG